MFQRLAIPEVFVVTPKRFGDDRGHFSETFSQAVLAPMTGPLEWVQDNQSLSKPTHVLRGLHFQIPPFAQDKLVRCLRGAMLDVAVDIRKGSPTFGKYVSAELTAEKGEQIFVPKGFAHGFLTLTEDCEVAYKVTNYYNQTSDRGVRWSDPAIGIDWGVKSSDVTLSPKDQAAPLLAELPDYFRYPA
jgi:dTDP-4-dehydrorhamnose 3,5-epimerase